MSTLFSSIQMSIPSLSDYKFNCLSLYVGRNNRLAAEKLDFKLAAFPRKILPPSSTEDDKSLVFHEDETLSLDCLGELA